MGVFQDKKGGGGVSRRGSEDRYYQPTHLWGLPKILENLGWVEGVGA